jgi:hypothetical protein
MLKAALAPLCAGRKPAGAGTAVLYLAVDSCFGDFGRRSMTMIRFSAFSLCVSLGSASLGAPAGAADLAGAWTTDASVCSKVFVKSGARVSFGKEAELSGGGFIIEGSQIRGPAATCRIKTRKEDGDSTHMIAACATDIMLSDVQFSVRSVNANEILRMFPNMQGMEIPYYRCPM